MKNTLGLLIKITGTTPEEVAKQTGVSITTIKTMCDETANPTWRTIKKLVDYFGVTYNDFIKD